MEYTNRYRHVVRPYGILGVRISLFILLSPNKTIDLSYRDKTPL